MSKGDWRRPSAVSSGAFAEAWNRIFGGPKGRKLHAKLKRDFEAPIVEWQHGHRTFTVKPPKGRK